MTEITFHGIKPPPKPNIIVGGQRTDTYKRAFIDGLTCYAWWEDGVQYVGTTGTTLKKAIEDVEEAWNYQK